VGLNKDEYDIPCPYCKTKVKTNLDWLLGNDRICCMSCNKAFLLTESILNQIQKLDKGTANDEDDDGYWD
jgi:hypothetical protein